MPTQEPPTAELVALGAPVTLRDGSRVRIRQGHRSDRPLLVRGFQQLSEESRYRRFLAPIPQLSEQMVRYLTEVDHVDHEALVALNDDGEGIGVARFVRSPARPETAEVAVTVIDEWQGRGLGTVLLEVIAARARAVGITAFTGLVLAGNHEMLELMSGLGPMTIVDSSAGTVQVQTPIPVAGLSPALRKLLRVAARRQLEPAPLIVPRPDGRGG
jgi:GNAT superfamily N-acetyltransferase